MVSILDCILGCFVMPRQRRSTICIFDHLPLYWQSSGAQISYFMIFKCLDLKRVIDESVLVESKLFMMLNISLQVFDNDWLFQRRGAWAQLVSLDP